MSNRVRFTIAIPRSDRVHYLTEADVRVVLSRLPAETYTGLRVVHLNDRNLGVTRALMSNCAGEKSPCVRCRAA